ncbi:G patch domain-containing protein 4 [Drosophila montana]|uniref:G patch domain-containing protein 4 n=1 Tax=Drosophila montana TaxID=40370 RepID=UPI00313D2C24
MDFAKKILGKYGWKEGDGLGKHNNGIAAPLKASLKFDNAGLGVDRATEFNNHWWERCFNEAASNVTVQVEQNGHVSTARKAGVDAVEISTKGYSARKLKRAKDHQSKSDGGAVYEHFLKSAMLTQDGGEVANAERIKTEDIAVTKVHVLTDEELFQACGGRTAHKGARHGLKLSGKLARLEQQEREMLAKLQGKKGALKEAASEEADEPIKIKKQRKKDKCVAYDNAAPENVSDKVESVMDPQEHEMLSKLRGQPSSPKEEADKTIKIKKKRKKDMDSDKVASENVSERLDNELGQEPQANSKKRQSESASAENEPPVKPKKKKKKHKQVE